jgi:hypothetical protein
LRADETDNPKTACRPAGFEMDAAEQGNESVFCGNAIRAQKSQIRAWLH